MSKVILSVMVSLDGRMARSDGDLNWFLTDAEFESEMLGVLRGVDAILLGRRSYELLGEYWPNAGTSASTEEAPGGFTSEEREVTFAELMNTIPKVVYSRTLQRGHWGPSRIVSGDIEEDLARMKRGATRDLVLFAGPDIASQFIERDLFDEYRLMVHPIVLGSGPALFARESGERRLRLERTRTFASGVVLLQYERVRAA